MKPTSDENPIVVISGMSGRLPGVNNVTDYAESLYNKKELVGPTKGRFSTSGIFEELPDSIGRVLDFEKFDNEFFNIKPELAKLMDPQVRKMLEVTLEAILDAGLSLDEIKGPRTGAFFGHIYSDLDRTLKVNDLVERQNNCSDPSIAFYRQLFQQWISYCLDLSGPTYHYESACSSAMYAISDAFHQIQLGLIDTALVVTANLNLPPNLTIQYFR